MQERSPMPTECSPALFDFAPVETRRVVAAFDGGAITLNAGALLLGATDRAIGLVGRFAAFFHDTQVRAALGSVGRARGVHRRPLNAGRGGAGRPAHARRRYLARPRLARCSVTASGAAGSAVRPLSWHHSAK